MAKKPTTTTLGESTIHIEPLKMVTTRLRIIGNTPMYHNRMAEKVKQTLLVGGGKKTAAEKKEIKHHPLDEFRSSAEMFKGDGPTALGIRVVAIKAAMCDAALETPGMTKTSAQRLLFMPGDHFALYGVPQLKMDVVRSADMNRTPDVRSRLYLPRWCAEVTISFVSPQLSPVGVATLLQNAGIICGIGDFRQQRGKGAYGSFRVIGPDDQDSEWDDLVTNEGKSAQLAALEDPEYADAETAELMSFYSRDKIRRAA